jgi:hypothetical protein
MTVPAVALICVVIEERRSVLAEDPIVPEVVLFIPALSTASQRVKAPIRNRNVERQERGMIRVVIGWDCVTGWSCEALGLLKHCSATRDDCS